jgi:hypothetical protein
MKQTNTAKSTSFVLSFASRNNIALRCQNGSIGSVVLGSTPFPTQFTQMTIPGNTLDYTPVTFRVLASENLEEWLSVYKWMIDITRSGGVYTDGRLVDILQLTVLNLQNIPIINVKYQDAWPTVLGDIQYSMSEEEETIFFDLTFEYSHFDVDVIETGESIVYAGPKG